MDTTIGLYDQDTGERGWLRYDTATLPDFRLWFQTKEVENRVRKYLTVPREFTTIAKPPKKVNPTIIDHGGVTEVEAIPTKNAYFLQRSLAEMPARIHVAVEDGEGV
jgi:hypothetical protein